MSIIKQFLEFSLAVTVPILRFPKLTFCLPFLASPSSKLLAVPFNPVDNCSLADPEFLLASQGPLIPVVPLQVNDTRPLCTHFSLFLIFNVFGPTSRICYPHCALPARTHLHHRQQTSASLHRPRSLSPANRLAPSLSTSTRGPAAAQPADRSAH
jgi:hypothetical protein